MSKRIMLIDGNSIGHQANNMPALSVGEQQTQAIYGYLKIMQRMFRQYRNIQAVVLWDGMGWRKSVFNEYKENRNKKETKNEILSLERKKAFNTQRPYIQQATKFLGFPQMVAQNMEADDLAAILANRYKAQGYNILLVTGDQDWLQLVDKNVTWRDQIRNITVTTSNFEEVTGVSSVRQFVEKKALMGDAGDGIPGVGGIGEKYAKEFLATYGSFADFTQRVALDKSIDPASLPKRYRDLIEDEDKAFKFRRNMTLVDLNTPLRPKPENLMTTPGTFDLQAFEDLCTKFLFNSILKDMDAWLEPFPHYQRAVRMAA